MRDCFSTLHDSYNGRLSLKGAVSRHSFVRLLVLLFGLFGLDLVDLDAVPWVLEIVVDAEGVGVVDFFPLGVLAENAIFGTCKGLKCALELNIILCLVSP